MKEINISKMRKKRRQQLRAQQIFVEFVLYLVFLAVLYLVSFSNRDPQWFSMVNHISHHLIKANNVSASDTTLRFKQVDHLINVFSPFLSDDTETGCNSLGLSFDKYN